MPQGGVIRIGAENVRVGPEEVKSLPLKEGNFAKMSIKDSGVGISKEHLGKVFDPYFTTKEEGSGLGLSTAYSIIKKHEGYISVESELGKGTLFSIFPPASPGATLTMEEAEEAPLVGKGRILIMDDEKMVREIAGEMLK